MSIDADDKPVLAAYYHKYASTFRIQSPIKLSLLPVRISFSPHFRSYTHTHTCYWMCGTQWKRSDRVFKMNSFIQINWIRCDEFLLSKWWMSFVHWTNLLYITQTTTKIPQLLNSNRRIFAIQLWTATNNANNNKFHERVSGNIFNDEFETFRKV